MAFQHRVTNDITAFILGTTEIEKRSILVPKYSKNKDAPIFYQTLASRSQEIIKALGSIRPSVHLSQHSHS